VVGCKRVHTRVEGTWVGKSYIEKERERKELKHEVKFYRRVEVGCYGNEPNIHPGAGGRATRKRKKKLRRRRRK
jgi:hypothetical protein